MTVAPSQPDPGLRRTVLPNGLTVLSECVPGVRSVSFAAWVGAASVHESRDRLGVSHLLEHMVFKGTRSRSARDIALSLEVLGGSLDAYTAREHTSYQGHVLDVDLEPAVDVVGDLIFRPLLRPADLEIERKVVLEEISMVDDTPDDLVFELQNEAMWGGHPYGFPILGTRETIGAMATDDLAALHDRAYHPPQIVVACAGNVSHEALLAALERTGWTDVPRGVEAPLTAPAPRAGEPRRQHVPRDLAQTHIVFGAPAIAHADPRRYALLLVSTVLGGGMSSRLFQRVREELGLAYDVHTFHGFHPDTGVHGVYVGTAPESARRAAAAVTDELARITQDSLTPTELAAGKSQLRGQVTLSLENVTARMYHAASPALYGEPYRTLDDILQAIDSITAGEVAAVCAEFLAPERHTVLSLGPTAA